MKRPPQSWLLPTLGILLLLHFSHCLRATSLIFAKTSTTSTEAPTEEEVVTNSSEISADGNQTKPTLTGIPQIDYIWDPNLPRELNGFNLTDYPFYETLPKDIDFKCDGLHDGFYASVLHKCQVYHHCLFGTRYDFLCANFTAFDQKTFICHFVSEVDCVNSPKYWHRNDALYEAASTTTTTTLAPITQRTVPTAAPAPRRPASPARRRRPLRRRRPQYEYYDEYDDEYETDRERDEYYDEPRYQATEPPRSDGRRRRKRPRPVNRRPEYDEYDEYEDERYDRRGTGRRDEDRRPYDRRPPKKDPRRDEDTKYDDEDRARDDRRRPEKVPDRKVEDRRRPVDDDYERRPYNRKSPRRPVEDDRYDEKDDRRPFDRRKEEEDRRYRPQEGRDDRRPYERPRKSEDDDRRYRPKEVKHDEDTRRYKPKDNKPAEKEEPKALVRPSSVTSVFNRPRAPPIIRRPVPITERDKFDYKPLAVTKPKPASAEDEEYYDDYEDELPKSTSPKTTRKPAVESTENDRRVTFKPRRSQNRPYKQDTDEPKRPLKDTEPRGPPKRPTENSEENKRYSNRPDDPSDSRRSQKRPADDTEDLRRPLKRPLDEIPDNKRSQKRPDNLEDSRRPQNRPVEDVEENRRPQKRPAVNVDKRPTDSSEEYRRPSKRPEIRSRYEAERVPSGSQKHRVVDEDFEDDYEEEDKSKSREETFVRSKYTPKERIEDTTKRETIPKDVRERPEPVVRVLKRPFLPSRGGNPYVARGLQPVGAKATNTEKLDLNDAPGRSEPSKEVKSESAEKSSSEEQYEDEPEEIKPLPAKTEDPSIEDIFKPVTTRPKTDFRQNFRSESIFRSTTEAKTTTQRPKTSENYRNPLDINENEYDVTLNDALNPTIPNLPIRSVPTGFGSGRDSYVSTNYQRPRFIAIEAPLTSASSDYIYQVKEPQGKLQEASSNPGYATYMSAQAISYQGQNYRHPSTASGHYYTTLGRL